MYKRNLLEEKGIENISNKSSKTVGSLKRSGLGLGVSDSCVLGRKPPFSRNYGRRKAIPGYDDTITLYAKGTRDGDKITHRSAAQACLFLGEPRKAQNE